MRTRVDSKREKPRSSSHAINRDQIRLRYDEIEKREDEYSNRAYARVEDLYNPFYAGLDPRRRQEMADGGMVKEDKRAMANLSQDAVHREYPPSGYYSSPYIDDSVEGE